MSFVEKNKMWILPLLGLGAAGVIWLNVRTFNPATTPSETTPPPPGSAPATPADPTAQAAPPPPEVPATPIQDEALWEDLRAVAFVPSELETRAPLEQQALSSLSPQLFSTPRPSLCLRPRGPEPGRDFRKLALPRAAMAVLPAPHADFLIDGPGGRKAWFDGQGYEPGQTLQGRPFSVKEIRVQPSFKVTLQGRPAPASPQSRTPPVQEVP